MSGFNVDLHVLDVHRRELQALISGLPDAKASGADNLWNFEAWGVAGQPFAALMNNWTGDASEYVDAVKEAGDVLVQRFADMCKTYADQEESAAEMFRKLREGLDGGQP
ncbi:hypothetical protein ACFWNN_27770 [Lentzea sp. NPDC058450]|uniref:hypothetical protein n=1 Tax=Lentzea sp. NPDC058450 TaxID=3346505 RepID=UPI003669D6CD